MKIDIKGKFKNGNINKLYDYLIEIDDLQLFDYMGLEVELDPTVDFADQNMLIRWTDVNEGFNDRMIVRSLEEFQEHFKIIDSKQDKLQQINFINLLSNLHRFKKLHDFKMLKTIQSKNITE